MQSAEAFLSAQALLRIFMLLLYAPLGGFCLWRLLPRLPAAARRLAALSLGAQLLLVIASLEIRALTPSEEWFWHLDREWNIQSVFAASQLALAGGSALVGAWRGRCLPLRQRRYLLAIGALLLFLGLDEFFSLKELLAEAAWLRAYALVGALAAGATVWLLARLPRRERPWLALILLGLALMAAAGMLIDNLPLGCDELVRLHRDECLHYYTMPEEALELLGAWLLLLAVLGQVAGALPPPSLRLRAALSLMALLWFALLAAGSPLGSPRYQLPAAPLSAEYEAGLRLYGYETRADGAPNSIFLFAPLQLTRAGLGYSTHLIDQASGASIAHEDAWADRQRGYWLGHRRHIKVFQNPITLRLPPAMPVNRAYWVVLTLWRADGDGFTDLAIVNSDRRQLSDTQLVLGEFVRRADAAASPPPAAAPRARFANGFVLEEAELPAAARAGAALPLTFAWRAATAGAEDLIQFLHFVHADSGALWNHDQQPLGARLPTRLWYSGLADSETWQLTLPADLRPGAYDVFTGLYRLSDLQRIAVSAAAGAPVADARLPLGSLRILPIDG